MLPIHVTDTLAANPLYRVRIGPLTEESNIVDIIGKIHSKGFLNTKNSGGLNVRTKKQ